MLLILSQSMETVRLFRRYKSEQMEELQQEKDQLAEERRQSAAMLAELQALRAQLGVKDETKPAGDETPVESEAPAPQSAGGGDPDVPADEEKTPAEHV